MQTTPSAPKRRGRPPKQKFTPQLDSAGEPVTVTADNGDELVQRAFSITGATGQKKQAGKRIRVFNKRNSKLFTSDGHLDGLSEGDILESDMQIPGIAKNCIRVG